MPLNSIVCPNCRAHINYAVDIEAAAQTVTCRRCGAALTMRPEDLDPVIRETVENLAALRRQEKAEQAEYDAVQAGGEDSVDVAIDRAQGAFTEARERLGGLAEDISDMQNTMGIIDEFVVGAGLEDLGTTAKGVVAGTAAAAAAAAAAGATQGFFVKDQKTVGAKVVDKVADKLKLADEERYALQYARQLYTYCRQHNIKLIDAAHDTEWQKYLIKTLDFNEDTKAVLTRLVESEQFKEKVSNLMARLQAMGNR